MAPCTHGLKGDTTDHHDRAHCSRKYRYAARLKSSNKNTGTAVTRVYLQPGREGVQCCPNPVATIKTPEPKSCRAHLAVDTKLSQNWAPSAAACPASSSAETASLCSLEAVLIIIGLGPSAEVVLDLASAADTLPRCTRLPFSVPDAPRTACRAQALA